MFNIKHCSAIFTIILFTACIGPDDLSEAEYKDPIRSIAFPIIDTSIDVTDFERESDSGNVSVSADDEGRVTVQYDGQVVSRDWSIISPPLPFAPFFFQEKVTDIIIPGPNGSPLIQDEIMNRIEFEEWNIRYELNHTFTDPITTTFTIPQITKDGSPYTQTIVVPSSGAMTSYITESYPLEGFIFSTTDNEFQILYDARLPDGTQVEFDKSTGVFQPFNASYIEGYLGRDTFPVQGNIVPVNLFSIWKSGGAVFENPTIELYVENALGLPLSAEFDIFSITTTTDEEIDVEADVIEDGISLNYPTLAERGEVKITNFTFNKENSNIKDLFSQRVQRVNYEIDAVYNKDNIIDQTQFIGEGGYFSANVSVVLPLEGNITDLVLQDTIDLDLGTYDEVISGEIKSVITNEFPLDLDLQGYFIDESGRIIDSLYEERFTLIGTEVDAQGIAMNPETQTTFTPISNEKWTNVQSSKRLVVDVRLNTKTLNNSPIWVYDNYDILLKIGAILEVNIN